MTDISLRAKKKRAAQEKILRSALRLFSEKGYEATSVAEIMEDADFAVGTFYNYFSSKESLLKHLLASSLDMLKNKLDELDGSALSAKEKISAMFLAIGDYYDYNHELIDLYRYHSPTAGQAPHSREFRELVERIIRSGQEKGELDAQYPPDILTELFMSIILSAFNSRSGHPIRENLNYKLSVFLDGASRKK